VALPLLLAGPIVRRVESRLVSVWVATSRPCTVRLDVWPGVVDTGSGAGVFTLPGAVATGERATVRVGRQLHVAVVMARAVAGQPLLPGARYSYDVTLTGGEAPADLRTLGLLADRPDQPALGYQRGLLPSFATCPVALEDLVVLHASCNRVHDPVGPNLFFAVDELIGRDHEDPRHRPHQLLLTGDQVYSDEVNASMGVVLNVLARELMGVPELLEIEDPEPPHARHRVPVHHQNFPPGYRRKMMLEAALLTTSEGATHMLGLGERCALHLYLWSPHVWNRNEDGSAFLPQTAVVLNQTEHPMPEALEDVPPGMDVAAVTAAQAFLKKYTTSFTADEVEEERAKADKERAFVGDYFAKVGRVRRALANVPTYMMCDDHDVTDDWYLCAKWKQDVLGNPLGRSIIRDGLVAYFLMQGWGNDPEAFTQGPGSELLAAIATLFPENAPTGPDPGAVVTLDRLLGTGAEGPTPAIRWSYTVDGAAHRVLVCDTRTRRGFSGPVSPPAQLPDGEREAQIAEGPLPAGLEVLLVVVPQPVLDPLLLGALPQGLVSRGVDAYAQIRYRVARKEREEPPRPTMGLATLDYEGWGPRPLEIVKLLDRLATYKRVLILSGDVHFAASLKLRYWKRTDGLVSEMGQLTCSAIQYITYPDYTVPLTGMGWVNDLLGRGYPVRILGWQEPPDDPLPAAGLRRGLRRRLLSRPVLLPLDELPPTTTLAIPPDFAYQVDLLRDRRPGAERPRPTQPPALAADFDATDAIDGQNGYGALARRHAGAVRTHHHTRRLLYLNKIGRITFVFDPETGPDRRLIARNDLITIRHDEPTADAPEAFTRHEIRFDTPRATPMPTIGSPKPTDES
jgi:hypothetical protein